MSLSVPSAGRCVDHGSECHIFSDLRVGQITYLGEAPQGALGYTAENVANKSTNVTTDGASDTKYASAKAIKTYCDAKVAAAIAALVAGLSTVDPHVAGEPWLSSGVIVISAG